MIEKYITILSILIVIRCFLIFPYKFITKNSKYKDGEEYLCLNRFFKYYGEYTWVFFWLAVLWLIIYYDVLRKVIA